MNVCRVPGCPALAEAELCAGHRVMAADLLVDVLRGESVPSAPVRVLLYGIEYAHADGTRHITTRELVCLEGRRR